MNKASKILSEITVFDKYSRYLPQFNRRETWEEVVDRSKNMHKKKYPHLIEEIDKNFKLVTDKKILPSMRSAQFAGKPIELSPARIYNCSATAMNHIDSFSELMFLLLSGTGVGYSVQLHHIAQLPDIIKPVKKRRYLVSDSIEGWADAIKVLMRSYFGDRTSAPDFDFSDIRPKGAKLKTSGGVAPGPEPLKTCIHHITTILDRKENGDKLKSIEIHDINCHIADCVLSGGIRRAAMISLFSFRDQDMLSCKFGKWYEDNPQRGRANNSVVLLRDRLKERDFFELWKKIEASGSGEPGFYLTYDCEWLLNPCAEIALRIGQFCNTVVINASDLKNQKDFNERAKAVAFIATLQAGYTDFHYLRDIWKDTTEREYLIGVSLNGIASGIVLDLDMTEAAEVIKEENTRVAALIGIKEAARCTTVKPEGTSSLVLGCSSGIHSWHSPFYIRRMKLNKEQALYKYLKENIPGLIEDDYFKPHIEALLSVPQKAPEGAITKNETALQLLARVKKVYNNWIIPGHRDGRNTNNISTTVNVKEGEWDRVGNWMWNNKECYTALCVLPHDGGSYKQAPFEEITEEEYNKMYKLLKNIDLSLVVENGDTTDMHQTVACAGGACEL